MAEILCVGLHKDIRTHYFHCDGFILNPTLVHWFGICLGCLSPLQSYLQDPPGQRHIPPNGKRWKLPSNIPRGSGISESPSVISTNLSLAKSPSPYPSLFGQQKSSTTVTTNYHATQATPPRTRVTVSTVESGPWRCFLFFGSVRGRNSAPRRKKHTWGLNKKTRCRTISGRDYQ